MRARNQNHTKRRTVWVSQTDSEPCANVSEIASAMDQAITKKFAGKEQMAALETEGFHMKSKALHEDPWSTFEPIAVTILDHSYVLARYKEDKGRLVQVRKMELQAFSDLGLQRTLNRISHPSFRSLLGCYHHGDSVFLAWEHVEVSVVQILASKLVMRASEIIAIVKPILEGIQYLAERGRVLATLTMNTIFLTQSGKVKIVGVEDSCEITASEMDAATLKLYALADIVIKLMGKCHSTHEWPVEIGILPDRLKSRSLREILQTTLFQQTPCPEELILLVNLTNKIAFHRVESHPHRV
ncbi:hypothetical protein N7466_001643 [Penicillium verhagenii]|uniref:uncharacterized protein n=1 Tax=Penicillium verhagenii TaxID=1562060 RepID=UPI00254547AF|nr:uncharacterized protein N7466_001643 [Penicillium verhagenii]KAJ5938509.1 hypothetical protein N7466_001643 [Penicillium verhagenii]